jgi:anti-anti-sigma factor
MDLAGDEDCKALIVDMGGVDFIASVGIRSLIRPSQALAMRGGKLAVANLNPQISEFFSLTGLDQMFRVYETVADAAAGMA